MVHFFGDLVNAKKYRPPVVISTQDLRSRGLDIQEREVLADIFRQDERSRERETHSRQTTLRIIYDLGVHSKFA